MNECCFRPDHSPLDCAGLVVAREDEEANEASSKSSHSSTQSTPSGHRQPPQTQQQQQDDGRTDGRIHDGRGITSPLAAPILGVVVG